MVTNTTTPSSFTPTYLIDDKIVLVVDGAFLWGSEEGLPHEPWHISEAEVFHIIDALGRDRLPGATEIGSVVSISFLAGKQGEGGGETG